jgi:hypothetical protein
MAKLPHVPNVIVPLLICLIVPRTPCPTGPLSDCPSVYCPIVTMSNCPIVHCLIAPLAHCSIVHGPIAQCLDVHCPSIHCLIALRVREVPGSIPGAALDDRSQNVDFVWETSSLARPLALGSWRALVWEERSSRMRLVACLILVWLFLCPRARQQRSCQRPS